MALEGNQKRRMSRIASAIAALAAMAAVAVAGPAQAGTTAPISVTPNIAAAPDQLQVDLDPTALGAGSELHSELTLLLARGMAFDPTARTARCTAVQASALACPNAANVGFGHAVVHIAGSRNPGGDADVVSYIHAFLGQPAVAGDPASIVFEIELLGVDRVKQAIQQSFGLTIRTEAAVIARVQRLSSGPYGLAITLDSPLGGFEMPGPVTAQLTRFKLQLGAVLLKRVAFYHVYRIETMNGPQTLRVADHRLAAHYLLSNPAGCPASGSWRFQIAAMFPRGTRSLTVRRSCRRGRVPLTPPPSPSAPERA
jgi:hypothetical protein